MQISNDKGRTFLVRVVKRGERYGLDDCLTHDEDDPLIEFYDLTHTAKFGPRGQFVSNYYAHTLAGSKGDRGLCLDGGNADVWSINAEAMVPVLQLAREIAVCKPGSWDRCAKCS